MLLREHLLKAAQGSQFCTLRFKAPLIGKSLIPIAAMFSLNLRSEEWLRIRGRVDLMPQAFQPLWDHCQYCHDIGRLIALRYRKEMDGVAFPIAAATGGRGEISVQNAPSRTAFPYRSPGDCFQHGRVTPGDFQQEVEQRFRDRSIKTKTMNVSFQR